MKKILLVLLLGCLPAFPGCAHLYRISVDSINSGQEVTDKTYIVLPGNPDLDPADLQFREFVRYLQKALQLQGYTPAADKQSSALEIYLSYGLGSPRERTRIYTVPVWGQTGGEVTTYESTVKNDRGSSTVSTTTYTPEYGVTGFTTQSESVTIYPKYVVVEAYEVKNLKPGEKMQVLWRTTINAEGKRRDLRHIFPIMLGAAAKVMGGNTGQEIEVRLIEDSAEVRTIKGLEK